MSSFIAPLPSGAGVTVIADHRPQRDDNRRQSPTDDKGRHPGDGNAPDQHAHRDAAPPVTDDEPVPAETLFATTLFANEMPRATISAEELKLRAGQGWLPPDSALRLKDKLI